MGHRKMAAYGEREHNGRYALEDYEYSRNHTKAETIKRWKRNLKKKARSYRRSECLFGRRPARQWQTEFNRATENLIETTWTYVNLQKEFPKLSETDSMIWKQMFVEWSNEFEEFYGRTDWLESEKTYLEAIGEFAKERILGFIGLERRYIAAVDRGSYHSFLLVGDGDSVNFDVFKSKEEGMKEAKRRGFSDSNMKFEEVWQ